MRSTRCCISCASVNTNQNKKNIPRHFVSDMTLCEWVFWLHIVLFLQTAMPDGIPCPRLKRSEGLTFRVTGLLLPSLHSIVPSVLTVRMLTGHVQWITHHCQSHPIFVFFRGHDILSSDWNTTQNASLGVLRSFNVICGSWIIMFLWGSQIMDYTKLKMLDQALSSNHVTHHAAQAQISIWGQKQSRALLSCNKGKLNSAQKKKWLNDALHHRSLCVSIPSWICVHLMTCPEWTLFPW